MEEEELGKLRSLDLQDMRERNRKRTYALYRHQLGGKAEQAGQTAKEAYLADRAEPYASPEEV